MSMNKVLECILSRRAIRKYKREQVSEEQLETILLAGAYAPSAGGRQSAMMVVCQNQEINTALGAINRAVFHRDRTPASAIRVSADQPSIADDPTIASAFYDAPTVITVFAPKRALYGDADCCVMAENMMLAAHSLGVGSCLVGRARDAFASEFGQKLQRDWGISEDYEARFHVALGYMDGELPKAKPRREDRIKRIY
jgi:nitroreductase